MKTKSNVNLRKNNGLAQIPLIIGLVLMAIAIPVATKLSTQSNDNRSSAYVDSGVPNPTLKPKATSTPKPKATSTPKPKATSTPKPKSTTKPTATTAPSSRQNTPTVKKVATPTLSCKCGTMSPANQIIICKPCPTPDCNCVDGIRVGRDCQSYEYGQPCAPVSKAPTNKPNNTSSSTGGSASSNNTSGSSSSGGGSGSSSSQGCSGSKPADKCTESKLSVRAECVNNSWDFDEQLCGSSNTGRYDACGGKAYCCNNQGKWTTDLADCPNASCDGRIKGDADNNGKVEINDISIWRSEFISGNLGSDEKANWKADFDCDKKVTISDASIWRQSFIEKL